MDEGLEWKILLIDDEEDIREVVSIDLADAGYHVVTAENGPTGVARFAETQPQIVITDIRMPGMDGLEVLAAIKKKDPGVQVIVITAFGELDIAIQALQNDASDFITKPVHPDALHLALKRAKERYLSIKQLADYTRLLEQNIENQARILHQDKMMALGRLAASVVHEINNPLSGMLNYLRLMIRILNQGPLAPEKQEKFLNYLDLIETETGRCSEIVSNLLSFSRKSKPVKEEIHLSELVDRCVVLLQHRLELNHITLNVTMEMPLAAVYGDINQLQQCIINLILNAADAMPQGGKLSIAGRMDTSRKSVILAIADTGTGIAPENLPHIFDPFFTTKQEGYGVGLGLSTVFGIMERHHGTVSVDSRPGEGTEFRLTLPADHHANGN
jgi:signal transduction histidine kinase